MNTNVHSHVGKEDRPLTRSDIEELLHKMGSSDKLVLTGQNLRKINLASFNLEGVNLSGSDLSKATLSRATLRGAYLRGATLSGATLSGADLSEAYLRGVDFCGADLCEADLSESYLIGADLSRANLRKADLIGANLNGADLSGANLSEATLVGADLSLANLRGANLGRAHFNRADLRGADLRGAKLCLANLRGANLNGADLSGADLSGAILTGGIGLNPSQQETPTAETRKELQETTTKIEQAASNATINIRIDEEPLTAQSLLSTLKKFVTFYTTCWLIQQERFGDALQYAEHGGEHFEKEANILVKALKYNSPAEIKVNIDLSPKGFVEALRDFIDCIQQIKHRLKKIELDNEGKELENRAKELENKNKILELEKKRLEYAIDGITKLMETISNIDEPTRVALKQHLVRQLLQLGSDLTAHITLSLSDTTTKQEQEVVNALNAHTN